MDALERIYSVEIWDANTGETIYKADLDETEQDQRDGMTIRWTADGTATIDLG